MSSPTGYVIELNHFARGVCVDVRPGIPADTAPDKLLELGRQCLLKYWKTNAAGEFVSAYASTEAKPVPDEVVVRARDGRAVYRRTIIEEKIARWFAES